MTAVGHWGLYSVPGGNPELTYMQFFYHVEITVSSE